MPDACMLGSRRMTLEQLRVYVAVAERQHMTRAAEALHLAQSAVSAAIAGLEARHGARLFSRVGRGIELTEAGTVFLGESRAVLARAEAAELVLSELGGLKRGRLSLHASQTIASYWLPRHLVAFRRAHPGIEIRLGVGNTAQVVEAVRGGLAELGFIEGVVEDPSLAITEIARDQLVVVVSANEASSLPETLAPADLAAFDWVLREPGSGTRSAFEAAMAAAGIPFPQLRVVMELPTNEAVRAAVEAGMGATAISASVAASGLEAGLLAQVKVVLPERAFHVIHHSERHRSAAATALMRLMMPGRDTL